MFRHLNTWGMILGFFGSVYLNWVYLTWLPGYLTQARGMDLVTTGFAASVPFSAASSDASSPAGSPTS